MTQSRIAHHPTLRQLLNSETMAEARIAYGEDFLDRAVVQVVGTLKPVPRAGSLIVAHIENLSHEDVAALKNMAGLIVIRDAADDSGYTSGEPSANKIAYDSPVPPVQSAELSVKAGLGKGRASRSKAPLDASSSPLADEKSSLAAFSPGVPNDVALAVDIWLGRLVESCAAVELPLIVVPGFGEVGQIADDIRMAFLKELKLANARLHASLMAICLDEGLESLVEEVSIALGRPVAVEGADFKVLASCNMGATPQSQQHSVSIEAAETLRRKRLQSSKHSVEYTMTAIRAGRRLMLPVVIGDVVCGFISAMYRQNDDIDAISEYLQAAALAVMVEFSQRRKDGSVFTVTQKSLLKDLLSGRSLSASDQERLERHFGFDLADGLLVFAVEIIRRSISTVATASGAAVPVVVPALLNWPDDTFITTEVEGTRIFVVPHYVKDNRPLSAEAESLLHKIQQFLGTDAETARVQIGASRLAETILDLPEAYREARQALVIASMVHGEQGFIQAYGDLGVRRLLYLMIDHPELIRFYEDNLAPLQAYDEEWESELVPSLKIYLQEGVNLNSAARALFIHRHTLRYRLEQIADILKVDIDSQEVLLNLQIAFLIQEMKGLRRENTES
jgi:purine catabolism regulator